MPVQRKPQQPTDLVLISTYWNVNADINKCVKPLNRFNLNLLECKFQFIFAVIQNYIGFNLNLLECKYSQYLTEDMEQTGFNLNLLECKFFFQIQQVLLLSGFNLNLLECKFLR